MTASGQRRRSGQLQLTEVPAFRQIYARFCRIRSDHPRRSVASIAAELGLSPTMLRRIRAAFVRADS